MNDDLLAAAVVHGVIGALIGALVGVLLAIILKIAWSFPEDVLAIVQGLAACGTIIGVAYFFIF